MIDGVTVKIKGKGKGKGKRIRLGSVDAPEPWQTCIHGRGRAWHCGQQTNPESIPQTVAF